MAGLTDKVAIVTGASSGIGAATVRTLLELGMKVVGLARRKQMIEELGKGYEGKLFALKTDVSVQQDILDAIIWTEKNVGPIYLLVNNAGIKYNVPISEATCDNWKKLIDTNLLGLLLFTNEVIKSMKINGTDGIIINMNSIGGHYPVKTFPGIAIYQASKFGITGFSESIRSELAMEGSKIRITSLSPGLVESEMTMSYLDGRPYIKSEDVANTIKFLITQPPNINITELIIRPTGEVI